MNALNFRLTGPVRVCLGLMLLSLLAGCVDSPPWTSTSKRPTTTQIAAVLGRQDHYAYFPAHEVYYNRTTGEYIYRSSTGWVRDNLPPRGVSEEGLFNTPSVALQIHETPERHHAEVIRSYPRDWGQEPAMLAASR